MATNLKAGVSKVTAKVKQMVQKPDKTVKNLTNPKTIREKTRAVVTGVKSTVNSVKKTVSGAVSKAEKFAGTAKLGLLAAAKTAKHAMVKYAVPNNGGRAPTVKNNINNQNKYNKGQVLGLFNAKRTNKNQSWDKKLANTLESGIKKYIAGPLNNVAKNFTTQSVENFLSKSPLYNINVAASSRTLITQKTLSSAEVRARWKLVDQQLSSGMISLGIGGIKTVGPSIAPIHALPTEAFVRFDPTWAKESILENGLQTKYFVDNKVWFTKYKYVKHVVNPTELETMLYNQKLQPSMVGKFQNGANLFRLKNVNDAVVAGKTNIINGIPQWRVNRDIHPNDIELIKTLNP